MGEASQAEDVFEEVSCNFCGTKTCKVLLKSTLSEKDLSLSSKYVATPEDPGIKTARIVQCLQCGLCYANPRPRADLLRMLYSRTSDPSHLKERSYQIRSASSYLRRIRKLSSGTRLLDVGCYTGFFLKAAENKGWRVSGIEPSEWASAYARETLRLSVTTGTFEEAQLEKSTFDVVTLFQVLEHVADPKNFLTKVHHMLVSGGIVAIEVPNIESLAARVLKEKWWLLKPDHFYYFSLKTLSNYLSQTGFQVEWKGTASSTFSLGHLVDRLAPYIGSFSKRMSCSLASLKFDRIGVSLNFGDLLLVYARKN